jgi:hypothetical protein
MMSFDLALSRVNHDMLFHEVPSRTTANQIVNRPGDGPDGPAGVLLSRTVWDRRDTPWIDAPLWDAEDIGVTKYSLWFINQADQVAQQIKMNLLSFLGEWFLDIRYGVPYLEEILVKNPRMSSVETILRNHIGSVPNVIRLTSFGMDWNRKDRSLRVEFSCETTDGPIHESVKLEVKPYVRS